MKRCDICFRPIAKQNIRYCSDYCRLIGQTKPRNDWNGEPYLFFQDLTEKATNSLKELGRELNLLETQNASAEDLLIEVVEKEFGKIEDMDENSEVYRNALDFYKKLLEDNISEPVLDRKLEIYRKLLIWENEVIDSTALINAPSVTVNSEELRRIYFEVSTKHS